MTIGPSLDRWLSPTDPGTHATEFAQCAAAGDTLSTQLVRFRRDVQNSAFLIVRVDGRDRCDIDNAIDAFQGSAGTTRLCLAGGRGTLDMLSNSLVHRDRVGWMLDDVEVATPLSEIVWERIEALRFNPDFVARAATNLRYGFVLESMLALARNLGLCTLGSNATPGGAGTYERFKFDYLPIPPARS